MANDMYRLPPGLGAGKPGNDKDALSLDTLVSRNVLKQLQRDPPPAVRGSHESKPGPAKPGTSGEVDLASSMAKRLSILERENKEKSMLVHRVQVENEALKAKLKVAEEEIQRRAKAPPAAAGSGSSGADAGGADDAAGQAQARTEMARLRIQLRFAWKQVAEMKAYMADRGVAWAGEVDGGAAGGGQQAGGGSGGRGLSAESRPAGVGVGTDADGLPLPPRPPEAPAAGGGAAIRRRISSPNPSGLPLAAVAAASAACDAPSSSSSSLLQRATSVPADADLPAPSHLHPHPYGPSSAGPSGRPPALPPLPKTPLLPNGPASSQSSSPQGSSAPQGLPCTMDQLLRAVTELNQVAGDGIGQLVGGNRNHDGHVSGAAVLHTPDAVRLVIFRDGLQVHRSAPKPYSDPAARRVIQDILDGYFPYVLKAHFPDGVPIKVVDRSSEPLIAASSGAAGSGAGGNIHSFHDLEEDSGAPEAKEHFLNRLPQTVIKNGKVIDIRGEIGRLVGAKPAGGAGAGSKADVALVSTPADALLTTVQRNHAGPLALAPAAPAPAAAAAARPSLLPEPLPATAATAPAQPEIATLQVKSEDGQQTFILKLQYDDTIASLRKCIDTHRSAPAGAAAARGGGKAKYEIRSAFPARAYTEPHETLRQAGLIPNATLFLRALS